MIDDCDSLDRRFIISFLGSTILGALPHTQTIADMALITRWYRSETETARALVKLMNSKELFVCLSNYVAEVFHHSPVSRAPAADNFCVHQRSPFFSRNFKRNCGWHGRSIRFRTHATHGFPAPTL